MTNPTPLKEKCPDCRGAGIYRPACGGAHGSNVICPACSGAWDERCAKCEGEGEVAAPCHEYSISGCPEPATQIVDDDYLCAAHAADSLQVGSELREQRQGDEAADTMRKRAKEAQLERDRAVADEYKRFTEKGWS